MADRELPSYSFDVSAGARGGGAIVGRGRTLPGFDSNRPTEARATARPNPRKNGRSQIEIDPTTAVLHPDRSSFRGTAATTPPSDWNQYWQLPNQTGDARATGRGRSALPQPAPPFQPAPGSPFPIDEPVGIPGIPPAVDPFPNLFDGVPGYVKPPSFNELYGPLLMADCTLLQKIFLESQKQLHLLYAAAMRERHCFEFLPFITEDEWRTFAIKMNYCTATCPDPLASIAAAIAPQCGSLTGEDRLRCIGMAIAQKFSPPECSSQGCMSTLVANKTLPGPTPWPFIQNQPTLSPLPWQINQWYTCSPETMESLFFKWESHKLSSATQTPTYKWYAWADEQGFPYQKKQKPSANNPATVLGLSAHGNPYGIQPNPVAEKMWWVFRKTLAVALIKRCQWALNDVYKSTGGFGMQHNRISPIDLGEAAVVSQTGKYPKCSAWAVNELELLGEQQMSQYSSGIASFIATNGLCK